MNSDSNEFYITLLRHGESEGNAKGYHQGQTDFPLSTKGIKQTESLAQYWLDQKVTFDKIISSPLIRALQTAQIIGKYLDMPVEQNPLWMERDAGMISGLHYTIAQEKYPQPDFFNPYEPFGINGESHWDVYIRAGKAVQDLLRRPPAKYLVVAHGGLLDMFMYAILGIAPQAYSKGPHFRFRNTAYAELIYFPKHHSWTVAAVNNRPHWQDTDNG